MNYKSTRKIFSILSLALTFCFTFTGLAFADGTATTGASGASSTLGMILPIVILFAVFYFFMIRPENKKKKTVEEMRNNLSTGDEIVTIGGIQGKIVNISGDKVTFETGEDRVRIEVAKWAISTKAK